MKIVLIEPIGITSNEILKITNKFRANSHEFISYNAKPENDNDLIKRAQNADIIILSNIPISENVIHACENLKMISVAFTGVDHIPMNLCRQKNILVSNAAGYSNHAVAELTIGSAINLFRKLIWSDQKTRESSTREGFLGSELHGKTFGIIGLGQIGMQVAHLANAFGCHVIAYNRSKKIIQGVEQTELDYLLQTSDIISIHVPLTEKTKNLISKEAFKKMKPSCIIINTARGAIIDNAALKTALVQNKIAGAAIDVYDYEPPLEKNYILLDAPNTLLLPHIGYATKEAIELRGEIVVHNINQWLIGKPQNVMN